ncbi:tripartite tricarboxylate transporter substrate binding protein [Acidovorax sp. sic0104]|uniref:Bug family tripartite tricarboxylate transporter substrate binding protein n=1 Tax=Acidovorax sp. sic0104 TaxID=2854784 RepID=UPI001C476484|nr:tripartite tricarboxylate transporter substrate binding protein [Acidovorax sp. sic0104]MBV7543058.1 tripartite tricarboxylate transporter substrate binding protein [Acidovorax sp. sic0104]
MLKKFLVAVRRIAARWTRPLQGRDSGTRRSAASRIRFGVACSLICSASLADSFPQRPLSLIVPYAAGGSTDVFARALAEAASKTLGQPITIDNRTGAGGNIGTQFVKRAAPDGYTLLMCSFGCAVAPALYTPAPFDIVRDFEPVAMLGTVPSVLVVSPSVPAKNLQELIVYAKAHPGKLMAGSAGVGSSPHMGLELFKAKAGIDVTHVPYKGVAAITVDLVSGRISMLFDNLTTAQANVKAGKLRALAVASEKRIAALPDVPTFVEAGLPGFTVTPWFGIMAPAGTPTGVLNNLNAAFLGALADPNVVTRTQMLGIEQGPGSRADLARFISKERDKWASIIRANGIRAD